MVVLLCHVYCTIIQQFYDYRVIQYASKFISWLLEQEGIGNDVITRVKGLESSISTARKCGCG